MTSVWPALWPPWKRTTTSALLGQPVDDLAFAFVAPLGADDHDIGHWLAVPLNMTTRTVAAVLSGHANNESIPVPFVPGSRRMHRIESAPKRITSGEASPDKG